MNKKNDYNTKRSSTDRNETLAKTKKTFKIKSPTNKIINNAEMMVATTTTTTTTTTTATVQNVGVQWHAMLFLIIKQNYKTMTNH